MVAAGVLAAESLILTEHVQSLAPFAGSCVELCVGGTDRLCVLDRRYAVTGATAAVVSLWSCARKTKMHTQRAPLLICYRVIKGTLEEYEEDMLRSVTTAVRALLRATPLLEPYYALLPV